MYAPTCVIYLWNVFFGISIDSVFLEQFRGPYSSKYNVNAHTQVRNRTGVMFAVWHLTRLCVSKIHAEGHTGENLQSLSQLCCLIDHFALKMDSAYVKSRYVPGTPNNAASPSQTTLANAVNSIVSTNTVEHRSRYRRFPACIVCLIWSRNYPNINNTIFSSLNRSSTCRLPASIVEKSQPWRKHFPTLIVFF
jgi:hypothetical protein